MKYTDSGLKAGNLKTRKIIFSLIASIFIISFIFFCTPFISTSKIMVSDYGNHINTPEDCIISLPLKEYIDPRISHYLSLDITASNTGTVNNTFSSAIVKWDTAPNDIQSLNQQRFNFNIDGINHHYYIPLGENKYWKNLWEEPEKTTSGSFNQSNNYDSTYSHDSTESHDSSIENGNSGSSGRYSDPDTRTITSLSLEFPRMEGIDINISNIILKERIAFPLDTYINQKFLTLAGETGRNVNPFLTPAYILLAVFLILICIFYFLFRSFYIKQGINIRNILRITVFIFILTILIMFSLSFIYSEAISVKSHWDAYKEYIMTGRLGETYTGFYDFEKFIFWLDNEIPEGENLIALVRGEPVYIMSEMAYNLYPRDIIFINISQKSHEKILDEVGKINKDSGMEYSYIAAFTENDLYATSDLILLNQYREDAGFIYKLK